MTPAPLKSAGRGDAWILGWAALLAAGLYFGTALTRTTPWFSREPDGYYGLQTAGFRSGHLAAAILPQAGLLALKDPYDPVANAPFRVHDMTLYRGRYYLYYGITPILIAFWPCVALTGWYPSEPLVVAAFCTGAVWLGLALLGALRRRHFPAAGPWSLAWGAACLVLANPLTRLVEAPQFYQVAISGAVLLQIAMIAALYGCLHSERQGPRWLGLASLLFGLEVGARPSFLPGGICLVIAWVALARRSPVGARLGRAWRLGPSAVLPAAACGAGLMLYNWLRFDSPFEFGMRYALAGREALDTTLFHPRYLLPSLRTYLFNPGDWSGYFPFFSAQAGQPYGFLRYTLWGWLALAAFLPRRTGSPAGEGYRPFVGLLAATVAGNLLLLAAFLGTNERYSCDFASAWLLLGGIGGLALSERGGRTGGRRWVGAGLGTLATFSLFTALAVFVVHAPPRFQFVALGRLANWPAYAWRMARGHQEGALRVTLELPEALRYDRGEPVFETGLNPGECDWLQLDFLKAHRARVAFHHAGLPALLGDAFALPADRRLVIEADCGSLLPPFDHPAFAGWTRAEFESLARHLQVRVNGEQVLQAVIPCYPASPADLAFGRTRWPIGGVAPHFTGRILAEERLPLVRRPAVPPRLMEAGPVELSFLLPTLHNAGADPLLVTGHAAASDLLYGFFDGHGRIRFGLDHFGYGGPQSEFVPYDPLRLHHLTVWMGSLSAASPAVATPSEVRPASGSGAVAIPWSQRLVVSFDGRTLLNLEQVFYAGAPETARIGVNPYGSTTAGGRFEGLVESVRQVDFAGLPPLVATGAYGELGLTLRLPSDVPGAREPLVVSGVTGAGDLLYVSYLDATHVAIGFDHWGVGGLIGPPFELDYAQPHRVWLTMGSLYPPGSNGDRATRVRVTIDGRVALEGRSPCHPSTAPQIRIGVNPIGGSTCGPTFTGEIRALVRSREPAP